MSCSNKSTIIVKQPKPYRFLVTAKTATGSGGGASNAKNLGYTSETAKTEQVKNAEQALDKLFGESVRYTEQTKTELEKEQARTNIGAASGADVETMKETINGNIESINRNTDNIYNLQQNKVEKEEGKGLSTNDFTNADKQQITTNKEKVATKQDILISGENIKTINNLPLMGSGNITIEGGKTNEQEFGDKYYDLNSITTEKIGAVYRFDDSGIYVMTDKHIYKLDFEFKKIYEIALSNSIYRYEAGADRNFMTKINNLLFICGYDIPLFIYDEDTSQLSKAENPLNLHYYGSLYKYRDKVFYCHRATGGPHIYVYDGTGKLTNTINNPYAEEFNNGRNYVKITDDNGFTTNGRSFDLETLTFSEQIIYTEIGSGWVVNKENKHYIAGPHFYFNGNKRTYDYPFSPSSYLNVITDTQFFCIFFTPMGKGVLKTQYGYSNTRHGILYDLVDSRMAAPNITCAHKYQHKVYVTYEGNLLKLEDLRKYGNF